MQSSNTNYRPQSGARQGSSAGGETLIAQIKRRKPLDEEIGSYVKLKPASGGQEMVGKCCFHEDDTPSLYVNPSEGTYCCRGCGATGNVVHFRAHMTGLDYNDAKMELAKELGLLQERVVDGPQRVLNMTFDRYRRAFAGCRNAQEYAHKRGISPEIVEKFGIGYCWGNEFEKVDANFIADAKKAGLYSEKSGRSYLGGRLTFPIRKKNGEVIAFAGRTLERSSPPVAKPGDPERKPPPKYLNTPETSYFNKSATLYGLHESKSGISKSGFALAVEGYMDVVMLHQYGFDNAVSIMGADANELAFETLWGMTNSLVFCLDGDEAGQKGTMRTVKKAALAMEDGQSISVAFLPDGMDPDEFVRAHGADAFADVMKSPVPLSKYLISEAARKYDLAVAEQRAAFQSEMKEAADLFPNAPRIGAELAREADFVCMAAIIRDTLKGQGLGSTRQEVEAIIDVLEQRVRRQTGAPSANTRKAVQAQEEISLPEAAGRIEPPMAVQPDQRPVPSIRRFFPRVEQMHQQPGSVNESTRPTQGASRKPLFR